MTEREALEFVEHGGVVLESARGVRPNLAEEIAGEPIRGSWWSHRLGGEIFRLTRAVRRSPDIVTCRLVDGKVTYVHRRLWPALARIERVLPPGRCDAIVEVHTELGHHEVRRIPLADRLPPSVMAAADRLDESEAKAMLRLEG